MVIVESFHDGGRAMDSVTTAKASLWRLHELGVEIWQRREVTGSAKHSHDEWQIARSIQGLGRWWCCHEFLDAAPSRVVVVPPGEVHASATVDGLDWVLESIYIPDGLFGRIAAEAVGREGGMARSVVDNPRALGWFAAFWNVHTNPATSLERESALHGLVACLADLGDRSPDGSGPVGVEPTAVGRARDYLHAFAAREVSLAELSAIAGLNPYRLNRAFRRLVGVPPHAYQVQLRVRHAEALLARGVVIADVAAAAGFFDQSHLGRHFKQLVGLAPGQYRGIARTS